MPVETSEQFFGAGLAVEIGQIQRELKKLWQEGEGVATRASRLNLVIFSDAPHSLRANTALVEQITRQHALRAILISAKPQTTTSRIRAWVNAHCQISKSGAKQRCSEQIAFQLEGDARSLGLTPNLIFSHLDSDLPLYLWRQGEFSAGPDERLMRWVDRLIYDSAEWSDPAAQFSVVRKIEAHADLDTVLADLNWTRLRGWRLALAQFMDLDGGPAAFDKLTSLEVSYGANAGLGAMLLTGWLGAQLGWKAPADPAADPNFQGPSGEPISVSFDEREGSGMLRVKLEAADGSEFVVGREPDSDFLCTKSVIGAYGRSEEQVLPIGAVEIADLVSAELVHGGEHRVYLKALDLIVPMLG
jgi:glucose-6-phosphate dehydrogenase assembly protein OpcA